MANILVLNGPNLNLLGTREPGHYGTVTLETITSQLNHIAKELGDTLSHLQTNAEHVLLERIHKCQDDHTQFIIINPGALTHTSIALRDALLAVNIPFVEVHLSNIYKRDDFRQTNFISDIALGVISGLGAEGYYCALRYAHHHLTTQTKR